MSIGYGREQGEAARCGVGGTLIAHEFEVAGARHAEPGVRLVHSLVAEWLALAVDVANELVGDRRRSRLGRALLHAAGLFDQVAGPLTSRGRGARA